MTDKSVAALAMGRSLAFLEEQANRVEIYEIVQRERIARDMQQWSDLTACYNDDSEVDISWFRGSGAEFSKASQKMVSLGLQTFHQVGSTVAKIKGNRSLAETGCAIHMLGVVDGIEVTVIGQVKMYARVERKADRWLMSGLRVLYIQDVMLPLDPTRPPRIDAQTLASYRSSYRFISLLLSQAGHTSRIDLPGVDQPATVEALIQAEEVWLNFRN